NLSAKFKEIAAEAQKAGNAILANAARYQASGMSATEAAAALTELGISQEAAAGAAASAAAAAAQATPALEGVASTATKAGTAFRATAIAGSEARFTLGALTGSAGGMEYALARLISQFESLRPLISVVFIPGVMIGFTE